MRLLRSCAVGGALLFTLDWLILGWSHAGYELTRETISSLSAHNARGWQLMAIGQLVFAVSIVALAAIFVIALGPRGWPTAVLLGLSALGTLLLTAFRTICTASDAAWCAPLPRSAYPHQQWVHGVGAGIAFASLHLACLACVLATWRLEGLRDVAVVALIALLVAVPNLVWFIADAASPWHGLSEKAFLTSLATFVVYSGVRLSRPRAAQ